MLGVSLGARLLRGVGGRHGQFGARGVSEGSAAMAAGESMAQRMVWVDLEVRKCGRGGEGAGRRAQIRAWDRGTPLSREAAGIWVSGATGQHGPRSPEPGVLRGSGTVLDCGVSFHLGGAIHVSSLSLASTSTQK